MSKNTQVNVTMPNEWRERLERMARIFSVEADKDLTFHDLIRTAVQEKYDLNEEDIQVNGSL
jgi:hypothetical protein